MRVHFTATAWGDYQYWLQTDPGVLAKINALIEDCRRNPFKGLGKPEPLKRELSGFSSRRITGEHRLVYRVEDKGEMQHLEVLACRYHYET